MSRLAIFDILGCDIIVGAIPIKDGLVSAEVAPEGAAFADELGADGHVVRYATHEVRANLTIVLKGSSNENEKLSALLAVDVSATNGAGAVPVLVKDNNGATLISATAGWVTQAGTKNMGASPGDITWVIRLVLSSPLSWIVGGN